MSRIFDALQQSKLEGAGFEFPLLSSLADAVPPVADVEADDFAIGLGDAVTNDITRFPWVPISVSPDSRLVGLMDQASLGAEKFRFLGVRLRQLQQARRLKKLLITSTIPEEGKSMVSANLAITLAQRKHQKVLLLEGDLRRPSLSPRFGLPRLAGMSEWLQGRQETITNIYQLEGTGFWFLPAGSPPENPLELMQSERLTRLLEQLTDQFDWIVVDSPPVVPLADTSVWMKSADGALLVVREGTTQRRQLQRGLEALERSKLLGVVLNSSTNTDHDNYYQRFGPASAKGFSKFKNGRKDDV